MDRRVIRPDAATFMEGKAYHSWGEIKLDRGGPPSFQPRAPVDLSWARHRRPALIALLAGLKGLYLDQTQGTVWNDVSIVGQPPDQVGALLAAEIALPLNLEMAATPEMVGIAARLKPHAACIVPEKRAERTTEGGLDAAAGGAALQDAVARLAAAGIRVSLFIEPDPRQLDAAKALGAPVVELHTGAYCDAAEAARPAELDRIVKAAAHARRIGLECHAGHGLSFANVGPVAAIPEIVELNIGHFLVGEAVFIGLADAVRRMRVLMDRARAKEHA